MLICGSENLNVPAVRKVQVALWPGWRTSGKARLQLTPVVGLKRTVCATVSLLVKATLSPTVIETDCGL